MRIVTKVLRLYILQIALWSLALVSAILISCSKSTHLEDSEGSGAATPESSSEPSREDLIEAVRKTVEGKSYSESAPQSQRQLHTCSQYEVDIDPNAKHNPELARCPRVGATYWTTGTIYVNNSVPCQPLPGPQFGWAVSQRTSDSWLVSYSGSGWDVSKIEGTSANERDSVRVSNFGFLVTAHQKC